VSGATDRKNELLADRALDGLSEGEALELQRLGGAGDDSFDLAAAAAALAELGRTGDGEALPEALAGKVLAGARKRSAARATPTRARTADRGRTRWASGRSLGWGAAAAAAVIAVFGWTRPPQIVERVKLVEVTAPPPRVATAAELRAELLAQAPDARTIAWSATPDPAARGATGDVVWSESRQRGYMRIQGLAANDPKAAQYQLWIFDARRNQAHPVDGGVFDVASGEAIVPIRAAIQVFEPKLFAVTVEQPGGVVVSKRERIVLTAAL
jgi:hypothetical protein